jgi:hypothetical protein
VLPVNEARLVNTLTSTFEVKGHFRVKGTTRSVV